MTIENIVLLLLSGLSTVTIAVIGFFLKATLTDFKDTLRALAQDLKDLQGWRTEHSLANRSSFRTLRDDIARCQKAIKRIKDRIKTLEGETPDD